MNTSPETPNTPNETRLNFAGIDVSKTTLEFALPGLHATQTFGNDPKGIKALVRRLKGISHLGATGLPVMVINPRQAVDSAKRQAIYPRQTPSTPVVPRRRRTISTTPAAGNSASCLCPRKNRKPCSPR